MLRSVGVASPDWLCLVKSVLSALNYTIDLILTIVFEGSAIFFPSDILQSVRMTNFLFIENSPRRFFAESFSYLEIGNRKSESVRSVASQSLI